MQARVAGGLTYPQHIIWHARGLRTVVVGAPFYSIQHHEVGEIHPLPMQGCGAHLRTTSARAHKLAYIHIILSAMTVSVCRCADVLWFRMVGVVVGVEVCVWCGVESRFLGLSLSLLPDAHAAFLQDDGGREAEEAEECHDLCQTEEKR